MKTIVYVSKCTIAAELRAACIEDIVTGSTRKNQSLSITGGLISTELHFAQVLEGPFKNVEALMGSIGRDPRHSDVQIVAEFSIKARRFPKWALAYVGSSRFVSGHVTRLIEGASSIEPARRATWLIELMEAFVVD